MNEFMNSLVKRAQLGKCCTFDAHYVRYSKTVLNIASDYANKPSIIIRTV